MKIVVTDLTRFADTSIVCLAGINPETGECIRPMFPGAPKSYLPFEIVKKHKIIPGSCFEADLTPAPKNEFPHCEDHIVKNISIAPPATSEEFRQVLENSAVETIAAGFGKHPHGKLFLTEDPPEKSIITLKLHNPREQFRIVDNSRFDDKKFKAHITDNSGLQLQWLSVTDLGFSTHISQIREQDPTFYKLNRFIWDQETVFLRIGLGRSHQSPDGREGYWIQINGIYSFPNYREDIRIYE